MEIKMYPLDYQKMLVMFILWAIFSTVFLISVASRIRNNDINYDSDGNKKPPRSNIGAIIGTVILSIVAVATTIGTVYLLINKKNIIVDYY